MKPFVKIIEDSISADGERITTFHVKYWRPVHAEVMTHRQFARNGRSGRAVPVWKLLREPIIEPSFYGSNKSGMSSGAELKGWRKLLARTTWLAMARVTRVGVRILNFAGLHKQWANRPLEWFGAIDVLITSTGWANWDALRIHEAAAPEIAELAIEMKRERLLSVPKLLAPGEWHLPYVTATERLALPLADLKMLSVARCARLTYEPFDGAGDLHSERARYQRLVVSQPVHASPAEHQATPDMKIDGEWANKRLHGNLTGFIQLRKTLANEFVPG